MNNRNICALTAGALLLGACATVPAPVRSDAADPSSRALSPVDLEAPVAPRAMPAPQDYSPTGMFAENYGDFLARSDRYRPAIRGSFMLEPNAGIDGDPGEFDLSRFHVRGRAPIVIDPDSVLLLGGHAEARRYEFSSDFGVPDENLGSFGGLVGYGRFLSPNYAHVTFEPGIYSDFEGTLHHQDYQFFGEAMAVYRFDENLYYKGGLRVANDFAETDAYPMVGLSWIADDVWRVDVLLPRRAELSYQASAATTFFGGLDLEGQEFRARTSSTTGKQGFNMHVQEIRLYVGGVHRFTDNLSAFGRFGAVVGGDHKFRTDNLQEVKGQQDPTLLFEVGVGWDF